jgi:hypothetical protein
MSEYSNGREGSGLVFRLFCGILIGNALITVGRALDDAPGKVRDVQIRNEQLYDQLDDAHTVQHLRLNPKEKTFGFDTQSPTDIPEHCTGHYEIQKDVATVVGDLACTQTVPGPAHT